MTDAPIPQPHFHYILYSLFVLALFLSHHEFLSD